MDNLQLKLSKPILYLGIFKFNFISMFQLFFFSSFGSNLDSEQDVLLTHGDSISNLAKDFNVIATSNNIIVGIANDILKLYGVQFHPEVNLTTNGHLMLRNFLFNIARLSGTFTIKSREAECIDYIRRTVGNQKVLVFFSIFAVGFVLFIIFYFNNKEFGQWRC